MKLKVGNIVNYEDVLEMQFGVGTIMEVFNNEYYVVEDIKTGELWRSDFKDTTLVKKEKSNEKEFAIYKGDEFLDIGTATELAKKLNTTPKYIKHLSTPANLRRFNKSKGNRLIAVKLDNKDNYLDLEASQKVSDPKECEYK